MQIAEQVLEDWRACGSQGVVLRIEHLSNVIDTVVARIQSLPHETAQDLACELLTPSTLSGGLPPLVRQLNIDCSCPTGAVVHFVYFWRVMDNICRRSLGDSAASVEEAPIALEAAAFRDAVLTRFESQSLTSSAFFLELSSSRHASADAAVWDRLEADAKHAVLKQDTDKGNVMLLDTTTATVEDENDESMTLVLISVLLLRWLQETSEDYRIGERLEKIRGVRDVLQCDARDASLRLSTSGWDLEDALQGFYASASGPLAAQARSVDGAWSSQSAKLKSRDPHCLICVQDFTLCLTPIVTQCCFQVLCVNCVASMTTASGVLCCPFCRTRQASPSDPATRVEEDFIAGAFRMARAAQSYCTHRVELLSVEILDTLQESLQPTQDAVPQHAQHDLRLEVVLPDMQRFHG